MGVDQNVTDGVRGWKPICAGIEGEVCRIPPIMLRTCLSIALATALVTVLTAQHHEPAASPRTGAPLAGKPAALDRADQMTVVSPCGTGRSGFAWAEVQDGVQICIGDTVKNILFYGPGTVRVNANRGRVYTTRPSLAVVAHPRAVTLKVEDRDGQLLISSARLRIGVDKQTGAVSFRKPSGAEITRERAVNPAEIKDVSISNEPTYEVKQNFTLAADESLYGLGQYNQSYMDYRGQEVLLVQTNIGSVVPMLVSTRRYGLLWDIYSKSIFKDGPDGASFWAESAPAGVDYYFISADEMDGVIAGYRDLTGKAPMFPRQAFGLFMSKERYKTQERLVEVVRNFRREAFPLDYIVQDWQYWGGPDGTWSGMTWDKTRYPDPQTLTRTLHGELHVKLMNSIWPSVGNDTALAHELDAKHLRFQPLHWISKQARVYDAYSPEGRAIYFKHIKSGLLDVGVDALWMDGTEVEVGGACHDPYEVERDIKGLGRNALGDFTRYLNPYSLVTTQGTYEGQRATSNKRVLTLTRSAWAGQQRYAALPWSGDTNASWKTLREQIAGGVNIAMSGLPYWTQDTGGFFVNTPGGEKNPEYQELFARWHQFGTFNPIYRIHGADIEREPYIFKQGSPDIYRSLLDAAHLRYRLLPYIYSLAWMSTDQGYTMMRGLPMDFPDDRGIRAIDDEYLFGPAFLVHPITRAMYHVSAPPPATIPTEALQTPDGKPGIEVEYFEGTTFDRSAGTTVDPTVEYNWPGPPLTQPPAGLATLDNFSARWSGFLTAPEEGEYEVGLQGDDGFRLWIDGKLTIEDWNNGASRYRKATVAFHKGQKAAVKIEFFNGTGNRDLRFSWRTPSAIRQLESAKPVLDNSYLTALPKGPAWYDFWTNARYEGGQKATGHYPLNVMPLFVRAGSIVPMGPVVQYATERLGAPYEIRIYPGANARFTVYEDDNETYDYERGQYATFELSWNDAAKVLTVGERKGSFPGMTVTRTLRVALAAPGVNGGVEEAAANVKAVEYSGRRLQVRFAGQ
jgi:alpha-D-xyloside xylohydrolase